MANRRGQSHFRSGENWDSPRRKLGSSPGSGAADGEVASFRTLGFTRDGWAVEGLLAF